jgi:hypothetical protein
MADMSSGIDRLPPEERLKRLRALEAQKRRELGEDLQKRKKDVEDELAKKKKELEALEQETKQELASAEELEEETLEEITREKRKQDVKDLERSVKEFSGGKEFVPRESLENEVGGAAYSPRAAPGFGQAGIYTSEAFVRAEENISYLLNAETSATRRREVASDLYRSVRQLADNFSQGKAMDESYAFNKLQQEVQELKTRTGPSDGYVNHIASFLNSIVDYRQEDERRREHR